MKEQKKEKLSTQAMVVIRLFAAVYLLYIVISLGDVRAKYQGGEMILYLVAQGVFGLAGLGIGIWSLRDLIQGRYIGGKMDAESAQNEASDEV